MGGLNVFDRLGSDQLAALGGDEHTGVDDQAR
jgi:hypothetical protein